MITYETEFYGESFFFSTLCDEQEWCFYVCSPRNKSIEYILCKHLQCIKYCKATVLLATYCSVFCKKAYSEKHCCNNNLWVLFSLKIPVEVVFSVWISDWRAPGDREEAKKRKAALNCNTKLCTNSTTPHALRLPGTAVLFLPAFSWISEILIRAQQKCPKTTGSKWSISNRPKSTFTQHLEMSRRMWDEFKAISPTIWFSLIELKLDNISVLCSSEAHTFFSSSTVQQTLLASTGTRLWKRGEINRQRVLFLSESVRLWSRSNDTRLRAALHI